ncbi:MAG: methyltransferase domain-containing protein [Alphaproteobacteria bacterium]|nr:methyltransferase domain-containing protein [Alphaproteobacteria bacterium]
MAKAAHKGSRKKSAPARTQGKKQPGAAKEKKSRSKSTSQDSRAARELSRAYGLAEAGRKEEALAVAGAILSRHSEDWPTLCFTAELLCLMDRPREGLELATRTLANAPDNADIRLPILKILAEASRRAGYPEAAIAPCEEFIGRYGPMAPILVALSTHQLYANRVADAIETAIKGIALFPGIVPELHHNRAVGLFQLNRPEEAIEAFANRLTPYDPKSSARKTDVPGQYGNMAESYDKNLLHRKFSRTMAQLIVKTVGATTNKRILDACCGTGALATHIRAAYLVGIDISPAMLAKARERTTYQELVEGDLVATMAKRSDRFDIIASSVALYYLADLGPFFREAARLLVQGGYLFFSTDPAPDSMDIGISGPGEYAHSRRYIRRLAAESGFSEIAVRIMDHRGNPGFWWALRRL